MDEEEAGKVKCTGVYHPPSPDGLGGCYLLENANLILIKDTLVVQLLPGIYLAYMDTFIYTVQEPE